MTDPTITTTIINSVLEALSKPEFKWRTIEGISKETGLKSELVLKAIAEAADQIVKSPTPSEKVVDLYTTRKHFRENATISERLLGAIKNRAI